MLLAIIMILCALPFGVGAVDDAKEAEITNRFNIMVDDDSPEYVKEIAEKSEIYDEFEVVSLREENVKHFALSDGTFEIVVYPYAIHEKSVDGAWAEKTDIQYVIEDDNNLDANEGVSRTNAHRIAQYYQIADNVISDTYVNSYSPSSNYGSSTQLYVGNSTMRAYFALPTPELPSNAKIIGSELNIRYWYNSTVTSGYVSVGVYEVTSNWNVSTLTWNNVQNGYGSIGSDTISTRNLHAGTSTTQSNPGSATIDVTSAVRDWYAGVKNYGIALEYIGGTNSSVGICSLETGYYPLYTINYTLETLPVENGTYFLYNHQLERYLQIDPNSTSYYADQANMEVWTFSGANYQQWIFTYLNNGYYKITSKKSGLSLAIKSGSENTSGGRVVQELYNGNARQQWALSYSYRGNLVIRPGSSSAYPNNDWVMTAAFGIFNGDGREVVQYVYSDNNDLKDEWSVSVLGDHSGIFLGVKLYSPTVTIRCTSSLSQGATWYSLIQESAQAWNNSAGTNISVTKNGSSPYTCEVDYYNGTWYGYSEPTDLTSSNIILGEHILINATTCVTTNSRKSTITHEMGHLLGLEDNPPVGNTETLMSHERDRNIVYTPQEYDVDNVKYLYEIN